MRYNLTEDFLLLWPLQSFQPSSVMFPESEVQEYVIIFYLAYPSHIHLLLLQNHF